LADSRKEEKRETERAKPGCRVEGLYSQAERKESFFLTLKPCPRRKKEGGGKKKSKVEGKFAKEEGSFLLVITSLFGKEGSGKGLGE